ncbi:hypothetical protein S83_055489 [Arachis hypogaea]
MGDGEARSSSDGDTCNRDVCEEVHDADTVEHSQPPQASKLPGGPKADSGTSDEARQPDDVNAVKGDQSQSEEDWSFPEIGLIVKDLMRGLVEKVQRDLEKETDYSAAAIPEKTIVLLDSDGETDEQSTPQSMKVASGISSGTPVAPEPAENSSQPLTGTDSIMRKLFRTPPSATRNAKRPRSGEGTNRSVRSGSSREKSTISTSKKMRFKITPAMDFNNRQSALFAYVFDGNLDPCEELVRIGVKSANRVDLHSLLPGNDVDDKIYVPMQDALGHWFLMLVSFKDRAIYNLDSSPNQFETPHREDRIRKTLRKNEIRATTAVNLTSTPFNKLRDRVLSKAELWRTKSKKNT